MHRIWNGKSSITITLLSDSFKETKMTKMQETKCPILWPFSLNTSTIEISAKIRLSFLGYKNNVTSFKKSKGN